MKLRTFGRKGERRESISPLTCTVTVDEDEDQHKSPGQVIETNDYSTAAAFETRPTTCCCLLRCQRVCHPRTVSERFIAVSRVHQGKMRDVRAQSTSHSDFF